MTDHLGPLYEDGELSAAAIVAGDPNATNEQREAAAVVATAVLDRLGGRRVALEITHAHVTASEHAQRIAAVDSAIYRAAGIVRSLEAAGV